MAIFIYVEKWDSCGEGKRAFLQEVTSQQAGAKVLEQHRSDDQVIRVAMIEGVVLMQVEHLDSDEPEVLVGYNTNTDGHDV